jgi:hypothetical protein
LVEERLLSVDTRLTGDPTIGRETRQSTVELTHEALLRQWGLLDAWLKEDFVLLTTLEGVKRAARDWDTNARSDPWLAHQGQRLIEALALDARPDIAARLDGTDRSYLATCRAREERPLDQPRGRSRKKRCYISYAWADETDPKREEKVDAFCEAAEKRGVKIVRDKRTIAHGDLISEFMLKIGEGDRVFIFLSDKYLHSPYCMFELFEMWRNNRQNKAEFSRRVRSFTVDGARIGKPREWLEHTKFWKQERDELRQAIDDVGWEYAGEEAIKRYRLMETFTGKISDVLALFADIARPRTFEDFLDWGFEDPPSGMRAN